MSARKEIGSEHQAGLSKLEHVGTNYSMQIYWAISQHWILNLYLVLNVVTNSHYAWIRRYGLRKFVKSRQILSAHMPYFASLVTFLLFTKFAFQLLGRYIWNMFTSSQFNTSFYIHSINAFISNLDSTHYKPDAMNDWRSCTLLFCVDTLLHSTE